MSAPSKDSPEWGERNATDVTSLLVELSRVLRGVGFHEEGDPARVDLLDRAYLAMHVELERAGPLQIRVASDRFHIEGLPDEIGPGVMNDLANALVQRGVERLALTPDVSREAAHALIDLLDRDPHKLEQGGGFERALAARCDTGILINDRGHQGRGAGRSLGSTPALATASLGSSLLAPTRSLLGCPSSTDEAGEQSKPTLEEGPLEAPASEERGERLLFRLIELDRCADDDAYAELAGHIVDWATEVFDHGLADECYRATLVLADHAVGEGGRSGVQARRASEACARLVDGERLDDLIDRACSMQTARSIRATQVLLLLGGAHVVPSIFERLLLEEDAERAAQLTAIIITLGEGSSQTLETCMAGSNERHARLAARLAGELQSPGMVPALVHALDSQWTGLRREAARALVHIGGDDAADALIGALSSERTGLAEEAALCLGHMGCERAVDPMMTALDRALRLGTTIRARELIRALGLLGNDRAVPHLIGLVERRALLRRREWREVKLAALSSLDQLGGEGARLALERIARCRDDQLRVRAQRLLATGASADPGQPQSARNEAE